jgi:uncharacterized ion transporter superfamily protein YfcC
VSEKKGVSVMTEEPRVSEQKPRRFKVPHTYVILFFVVILAVIGTYVLPAGVYDRVKDEKTGRTVVAPESYHHVEQTPVSLFKLFEAVPKGMKQAAEIIFFIFICGGAFAIIQTTGAIDASISRAVLKLKGKEKLLIPVTMAIFSIGGFTYGMAEEVIVFIPIGVALARAVGYDDVVGVAMMSTGAAVGFSGGMLNPFTVGVAQGIAELPLFSGMALRWAGYVALYIVACWWVMRYAARVKADPTQSLVYDFMKEDTKGHVIDENIQVTGTHKLVLLAVVLSFAYMIYGVIEEGFYIMELSAVFLAMGIVAGLVGKLSPSRIARSFVEGCQGIAFGALVVGIARAILVVMTDGQIVDTVINSLANWVAQLPGGFTAVGMFWVQSFINFFIPSGSGQAATTMPIMTPLADLVGVTRQTAVLAYQYGDGFSNQIIPTSAALMGVLGMAKLPYEKWFKFIWPLMVFWTLAGSVMVYIAAVTGYGPF